MLPDGLLEDVKSILDVTWTSDSTDKKIKEYITGGIAYLNGKGGLDADYTAPGLPRTLLFEYCRYARDAALDVFENNYRSMILAMQNKERVSAYVEGTE